MHLLIQNPFWHKYLQSLPTTTGLHARNVIWCSNRCHLSPSLSRTCFSKIISMIELCTIDTGSTCIERIQVDLSSAVSIILKRLLYFLSIPLSRLSTTTTTIYGFNAGSSHLLGKIRLRCKIKNLKLEVTCYVIDAETSYNFLLGRPWIHANWIVPSTLHQCFSM